MNDGTLSSAALLKGLCWGRLPSAKSFEWGFDVQGRGAILSSWSSLDIWEWSQPKGTDGGRVDRQRKMGLREERCSAWLGNARGHAAL